MWSTSASVYHNSGFYIDVDYVENVYSRKSFFDVIHLLGPVMCAVIISRHRQHDMQLTVEAEKAIVTHAADSGRLDNLHAKLNIQLELETTLCSEYRYV